MEGAVKQEKNHSVKSVKNIILDCAGTKENQDVEDAIGLAILQKIVKVRITNNLQIMLKKKESSLEPCSMLAMLQVCKPRRYGLWIVPAAIT